MALPFSNCKDETQEAVYLFVVVIGEVARDKFDPHVMRYCRLECRHLVSRTVYSQEGEANAFKPGKVTCSLVAEEISLPGRLHCVAQIPYLCRC